MNFVVTPPPKEDVDPPPDLPNSPQMTWFVCEYTALTKHFEEVWKSGAQNLSYVAIASAAILTFGTAKLQLEVTVAVATIPLAVWFFGIYLPFARYATSIRDRASAIESEVQRMHSVGNGHFSSYKKSLESSGPGTQTGVLAVKIASLLLIVCGFVPLVSKVLAAHQIVPFTTISNAWEKYAKVPSEAPTSSINSATVAAAVGGLSVRMERLEGAIEKVNCNPVATETKSSTQDKPRQITRHR